MKKTVIGMFFLAVLAFCVLGIGDVAAVEKVSQGPVLDKVYQEQGAGYSIRYPGDWIHYTQAGHTVVFIGKKGGETYLPTVTIKNVFSVRMKGGKYKDVDAVIQDFEAQLKTAKEPSVYEPKTFFYTKNGLALQGKQFVAEYALKGEKYKQWVIIIPRGDGQVFHVWSYTSPASRYENSRGIAKAMLDSWTIK
ncbi:hypothetical protein [Syntrophorhabdus aromaticivorans]|jgi:hypothetical protein|uniref:hypothetical protein n=1 Tax=Syntrophorhabdus aromaticivorans TaxID=328301 RepID=UPI00040818E1|nr:hypothetical protein [Syntrophorhabdus aromaticivorans]